MNTNARELWWRELTKQGDPARRPNLVFEAFEAGYRAGAEAETERCAAIVRSIIHRIEMNAPATRDD